MDLKSSVENLPNTSSITIRLLKSIDIHTFFDLINYFPYRYENYSLVSLIAKIQEGEMVTVKGKIVKATNVYTKTGLKIQKIQIEDKSGKIDLTWYNQLFLLRVFKVGSYVSVSGPVIEYANVKTIEPKEYEVIENLEQKTIHTGRLVPVYPEKKGISSKTIRSKIHYLVENLPIIDEIYPSEIISFNNLVDLKTAYRNIHFPATYEVAHMARARLAFDELFTIQLSATMIRKDWEGEKVGNSFKFDENFKAKIAIFIQNLPFLLTRDQKKVIEEIIGDLKKSRPMNRFLEGEVGSGKTVVAAVACYLTCLNGYQSLLMAPTEILTQQHYKTISELFKTSPDTLRVGVCLATSSAKPKKEELEKADIVIGTHALIAQKMKFDRVGLVVIDEQHRFGVRQRAILKEKAINPHLLTMTATPIPRTVLLTLYGELDLSLIDEMPVGRISVKTFLVPKEKRAAGYRWISDKVKKERIQVFVICPLIEESEVETMQSLRAAKKEYEYLRGEIFTDLKVGLLHGKLKSKEKEQVMVDFKNKKYDVLVATSVVEVGIDVPNATIIIVEGADRFGMAQLHQLRGRVGRGDKQSYCFLFTESTDESTFKRLELFCKTQSGIKLAEYDLKLRGPGDIYGTKQSGFINLKVASLGDINLIHKAKNAVKYFMNKYPDIAKFPEIKKRLDEVRVKQISRD